VYDNSHKVTIIIIAYYAYINCLLTIALRLDVTETLVELVVGFIAFVMCD